MCIMIGAAAASTLSALGAVTGVASSVMGIQQQQQQVAYQQQQTAIQYENARQQAINRNQEITNQYVGEAAQRDRSMQAYQDQLGYNMDAQNRATMEQQTKLDEARTKAAFKSQEIYAKSIGAKGAILASGRSGQSVGLLAMDADRVAGMQQAEQDAMVKSASRAAQVGNEVAATQRANADVQAWTQLAPSPLHPQLAGAPAGSVGGVGVPTYNWF